MTNSQDYFPEHQITSVTKNTLTFNNGKNQVTVVNQYLFDPTPEYPNGRKAVGACLVGSQLRLEILPRKEDGVEGWGLEIPISLRVNNHQSPNLFQRLRERL